MKIHFAKPPLPVEEQVELLQSRGLGISDPERAGRYLLSIGYYRLSAYFVPFEISRGQFHRFKENVSFDDVLDLYIFDRKLRCLFWEALERVEIHIRTQWVYNLTTLTQDPFAHLNSLNFSDAKDYQQDLKKLREEVSRSRKETFVKHFFDHYDEELPPLWACVHLMTLGELIRWVNNTQDVKVKNGIAQSLGFAKYFPFHGFAVALTELRNVCAHHVRLWNRSFMKAPKTVKSLNVPGFESFILSSDIRIDPQNDIKIDPPPKGTKERHLTCRPGTAGRPWRGKARQMPFLAAAPRLFIQSYPTQTLSKCLGSRNGNSLFIDCSDACALASS